MRKTICASALGIALLSYGSEAFAQAAVHTADVLRPGENMLYGEVGWPDFTMGFQHGMSQSVDIGVALSIIYGPEYRTVGTQVGLGIRVPIRITPVRTQSVSFQIHFDPGIKFDSFGGGGGQVCVETILGPQCANSGPGTPVDFGFWFYFGLDVGIHLTREATLTLGMEAPFYMGVTGGYGVHGGIPLLFGPGFEYDINEHIGVGMNLKFGPSILAYDGGNDVAFGMIVQPFFGYKL
jgi:hypothetical protein